MNNVVKTYTWSEFLELQKEQKHNHLGLYNVDGTRIVAFNPNTKPVAPKLKEIERALGNPTLSDGLYVIKGKPSMSAGGVVFDYPIIKGNPESQNFESLNEDMKDDKPFQEFEPNVTSYSKVLELNIELERMKFEIKNLEEENKELKEIIEDYEKETDESLLNDEQPNDFISNAGSFFEKMLPMLSPVIDKHYELKERQINLQEKQFQTRAPEQKQVNQKPAQQDQVDAINYTDDRIQEFIAGCIDEAPELYEQMKDIYNSAQTLDEFFKRIQSDTGEENYQSMITYINTPQDD